MYQTRHTFATLALSSGEALDWVAKMLGHRTTQMVIRHYHKYVPNLTRRDGDALARALDKRLRRRDDAMRRLPFGYPTDEGGYGLPRNPPSIWSGRPESNRRRPAWEAGILPLNYARIWLEF